MASPWQILVGQFGVIADIPKIANTVAFFLILGIAVSFRLPAGRMLMTLTASCRRNSRPLRRSSPVVGRKVSDEFTVPLCRTHHRDNHRFGDEVAWWD
jgi:hypothetical protein